MFIPSLKILKLIFPFFSAWIVDYTCEKPTIIDRLNFQNKYAGNSFPSYQYSQKIKCSQGKRI